ncbi:MAG: dTDP-4-dehydrorhamnose 3,5-epimerase [Anaerolineae bacterium]|nr:dTDP-4-dehydrorhamnose 3,5-epimerase [Anaerolineae bacterium]
MKFTPTHLKGAYVVDLQRINDERGFFARSWCESEADDLGLDSKVVQCNISYNKDQGTLRGMHLQLPPFAESKLVRCTRGSIYDVILDLRTDSETYMQWTAIELTAENRTALFVPKGFAHGFQILEDDTEIFYQMSAVYSAEHARGVRWNDPNFSIIWPLDVTIFRKRIEIFRILTLWNLTFSKWTYEHPSIRRNLLAELKSHKP